MDSVFNSNSDIVIVPLVSALEVPNAADASDVVDLERFWQQIEHEKLVNGMLAGVYFYNILMSESSTHCHKRYDNNHCILNCVTTLRLLTYNLHNLALIGET